MNTHLSGSPQYVRFRTFAEMPPSRKVRKVRSIIPEVMQESITLNFVLDNIGVRYWLDKIHQEDDA